MYLCPSGVFLSGLVADFGSISEHYLKNMALGLLAKEDE